MKLYGVSGVLFVIHYSLFFIDLKWGYSLFLIVSYVLYFRLDKTQFILEVSLCQKTKTDSRFFIRTAPKLKMLVYVKSS